MKECTGRGNAEKFSINCRKLVLCVFYETILFISGKAGSQFDCRPLLGSFCCACWRKKYAEPEKAVFDLIIQGCVIFLGKGYNTARADAMAGVLGKRKMIFIKNNSFLQTGISDLVQHLIFFQAGNPDFPLLWIRQLHAAVDSIFKRIGKHN